jgi:hypothetical protein
MRRIRPIAPGIREALHPQRTRGVNTANALCVDGAITVREPQSAHWKPLASFPVP